MVELTLSGQSVTISLCAILPNLRMMYLRTVSSLEHSRTRAHLLP